MRGTPDGQREKCQDSGCWQLVRPCFFSACPFDEQLIEQRHTENLHK